MKTRWLFLLLVLVYPIQVQASEPLCNTDSLQACKQELEETQQHRDHALTRAWEAERRTTGPLEVGACILLGAGVGLVGKNVLLGAASAGLGCMLALPF
jgi:hypothetical protein